MHLKPDWSVVLITISLLLTFQNWNSVSEVMVVYVVFQILNWDDQGCGFLIMTIDAPALPVLSGAI
jgi:hypothetical protein